MTLLYSVLLLLLIIAFGLLAIPFLRSKHTLLSKDFCIISILLLSFSFVLYQCFGQSRAVEQWLAQGRVHYMLMVEFERLGGIDGIIVRLQNKLASHPDDAKGWFILGKLYYGKQDYVAASEAFSKAYHLNPNDVEIKQYYSLSNSFDVKR